MNTDKVLALAREAGFVEYELEDYTDSGYDKRYFKFAALIQRQMIEDGWRQCAAGQGTTQFCGIAEELRKDAERYRWLTALWPHEITKLAQSFGEGPTSSDVHKAIDRARSANDT